MTLNLFLCVFLLLCFCLFVWFSLRYAWWRKNISYAYPRVLMYHMVCKHHPKNKSKFNRLRVPPEQFEKQLMWLKRNGFKSYTLSEIVDGETIPEKAVVLTFDDGYRDNYLNVFPLLKKYNMKATIYVVLERSHGQWATDKDLNSASDELNNEEMLSDDEIREMLESGLVEIGSHTLNHSNLPTLSRIDKRHQIMESKKQIEETFGISCDSFAYPFGFYDTESIALVKESGYANATTTVNDVYNMGNIDAYEIPRIMISGRQNMLSFILKIKKCRNR